jgi:type IV pilus assembly protein PilY1
MRIAIMKRFFLSNLPNNLLVSLVLALGFSATVNAAPGVLTNKPLYVSSYIEPNIMFLLDTSGSMGHIVAENSSALVCDSTDASYLAAGSTVTLTIVSSTPYANGKTLGTGDSAKICFGPTDNYLATLNTSLGGNTAAYTGAYLNWYFDTATDDTSSGGSWADGYKPGTRTRIQVAQAALNDVVNNLTGVYAGLSTYDGDSGAAITQSVLKLTPDDPNFATNKTTLTNAINATSAGGWTPLAESLRDLGRYFSNDPSTGNCGGGATNLSIDPDGDGTFTNVGCTSLLSSRISTHGPIQYSCQKNFAVIMSDGLPTHDRNVNSNLKDFDQDCTAAAQTAGGYTCDNYDMKSTLVYPTSDSSDYLDDVAKALFETDLRPDFSGVTNNVITYAVGFADLSFDKNSPLYNPLMEDTSKNGGGEFLFSDTSSGLTTAFAKATSSIIAQTSTAAAVTFNSSNLSSNTAVYQALFNTAGWSGDLRSYPLDGFTGDIQTGCTAGTSNCWGAATQLDGQTASARTILFYDNFNNTGLPFVAPADYTEFSALPAELQADLCASPGIPHTCNATTWADATMTSENIAYIADLINYLRGNRSEEGSGTTRQFRTRAHVLGDLVNASPVFVGQPVLSWPDEAPFPTPPANIALQGDPATDPSYAVWKSATAQRNRKGIVYAAANDGMLHGFRSTESAANAGDAGEEVLAFIPSMIFDSANNAGLHYLANPNYDHNYYNDLTPTISDVYIKHLKTTAGTTAITATPEWRTVLLGGLRGGGKGLYLLDITDPTTFTAANAAQTVEWEFTHNDLGYTYSKPTIAMMNNGRFAAIFGNGYNDDPNGDGEAKLFIVYLDGGQDGVWTDGSGSTPVDYQIITTGVGSMVNSDCQDASSDCNGLSTPAVADLDGNGTADRVYAGDLKGNLWAFDLCNWDSTNSVCQSSGWGVGYSSSGSPAPIMTAQNDAGDPQPITVKPILSRNPERTGNDIIIAFGTGQYLVSSDPATTETQTFYGVFEDDALINGGDSGLDPRSNSDGFVAQTIGTASCGSGCTARTLSSNNVGNSKNGWYIDLDSASAATGERVITDAKIRNNILFFDTLIPNTTVCEYGGSSWLMSVDIATGSFPSKPVFDANGDGVIDSSDTDNGDAFVGKKIDAIATSPEFLGGNRYVGTSNGTIEKDKVDIGISIKEGRMSWRELIQD